LAKKKKEERKEKKKYFEECEQFNSEAFYPEVATLRKVRSEVFYRGDKLDERVFYRDEKYIPRRKYIPRSLIRGHSTKEKS